MPDVSRSRHEYAPGNPETSPTGPASRTLVVAGGVAANQGLRERLADEITEAEVVIPPLRLCGDNAGMISLAAAIEYDKGHFADLDLNAKPSLAFDSLD